MGKDSMLYRYVSSLPTHQLPPRVEIRILGATRSLQWIWNNNAFLLYRLAKGASCIISFASRCIGLDKNSKYNALEACVDEICSTERE